MSEVDQAVACSHSGQHPAARPGPSAHPDQLAYFDRMSSLGDQGQDGAAPAGHQAGSRKTRPARWGSWWLDRVLWPLQLLGQAVTAALLLLIGFYQKLISPALRPRCRFLPSCSEYAALSLRKYGLWKGLRKTLWRLARCQPLCKGGYDEP